jgi:hypothetical protein
MKRIFLITVLLLAVLLLPACSSSSASGPESVGLKYFQAIAAGNEDQIAAVSCKDWESDARSEVAAFKGVKARLDQVSCKIISSSGQDKVIECSGAIIATYNNEDSTFELQGKQLKMVSQGGEWLVCGYAQ